MPLRPPYITASALIRYCYAKPPERTRIIREFRDQPFPPFKGWYGETEGAIRRYLATGGKDAEPLDSLEVLLQKREAASDHDEAKLLGQLHALEVVREIDFTLIVKFGAPSLLADTIGPMSISNVRVSVRPTNLLIAAKEGQVADVVGAIKPYLASTDPLGDDSGALFASLVHWYAEECLQDIGQADRRLAFVIDVFQKRVFQAPQAYKQRREILKHACQEIFERWYAGSAEAGEKSA